MASVWDLGNCSASRALLALFFLLGILPSVCRAGSEMKHSDTPWSPEFWFLLILNSSG